MTSSSSDSELSQCQDAVDAGAKAYMDNCALCHEPGAALYGTGGPIDVLAPPYGKTDETDLAKFIEVNMAVYVNDAECKPEFEDCSANVAAYLQHAAGVAWCPGDVIGGSSSEMSSSSEIASSSEATSSSDPAVSSSSDAPSSEMSSSSDMSSSSQMDMSSSSEMVPSSSEMSSSSIPASSSSAMSSSSEPAAPALVEFIYPTQKANLANSTSTKVMLKVLASNEITGTVTAVQVGNISLTKQNDIWVSGNETLDLAAGTPDQEFTVILTDSNGTVDSQALTLSTHASGVAGDGSRLLATGLGFDNDDGTLYFTDPDMAQLFKLNSATGQRDVIYSAMRPEDASVKLYWSMDVDSANDTVYIAADTYGYGDDVGTNETSVELTVVNSEGLVVSYPSITELQSARSMFVDLDSSIAASQGLTAAYLLDFNADSALQAWYTSGAAEGANRVVAGPTGNVETNFSGSTVPLAMVENNDSIIVAREFSPIENGYQFFTGSLTEVNFSLDPVFGSLQTTFSQYAVFDEAGDKFTRATAMAYNRDMTVLYIASTDAIWAMDLSEASVNKPMTLLSSSFNPVIGSGPKLGSSITDMELHPMYDILYVAAGAQGVIAIDLATGNRITVAR